jgi:hypothetical protein
MEDMEKLMTSINRNPLLHFSLVAGQNQSLWDIMTASEVFCKSTECILGRRTEWWEDKSISNAFVPVKLKGCPLYDRCGQMY